MQNMDTEAQVQSSSPTRQNPDCGAPALVSRSKTTYRLRGVHESFDQVSLKSALRTQFGIEDNAIVVHSLAIDVGYNLPLRRKVAIITFKVIPDPLEIGKKSILQLPIPGNQSQSLHDVVFDTTFEGFTPLTAVEQEIDTTIDCILIHGWAGHPIGSFSSPDGDWIWPIDGLCHDLPSFRVWLYGFSSNLQDSNSTADVYDYAKTFRNKLVDSRRLPNMDVLSRPIVYIVHSLGGWILLDTINEMASSHQPEERVTLEMTRGALLFGVPLEGMNTRALATLLRQDDLPAAYTAGLLDERYGSTPRMKAAEDFYAACARTKALVYTFFETMKTPTVCFDESTQRWARNGPAELLVKRQSATYGCHTRQNAISWESNHNNMLKLRKGDFDRYQILLDRLRAIERIERSQTVHTYETEIDSSALIRHGDELIHGYYRSSNRLRVIRLSGEELELEKCYINLALKDRSRNKKQKVSFSLQARLKLDASEIGESIPLENLFDSRRLPDHTIINPRRVFIQGQAGVGKTTLSKKIVDEFLRKRLGSTLFDRVMWIPLRKLRPDQGQYGWKELLQDTFDITNHRWSEIKDIYARQFDNPGFLNRTLFLLDGLDEVSRELEPSNPMYNFLNTILCDIPNIIITSRPQTRTLSMKRFDLDLETLGFTADQVEQYMRNCVLDEEKIARMKELMTEKPLIKGLLRIPVQLDAFCYTWPDQDWSDNGSSSEFESGLSATTMTMLYHSIVAELCKKDFKILKGVNEHLQLIPLEIQAGLRGELTLLEQLAFQGMSNNVVEFTPRHWERLANHFYESDAEISKSFSSTLERLSFLRTSDHREDLTKRSYHFLHLTFQEFFAARYFSRHWRQEKQMIFLHLNRRTGYHTEMHTKMPFMFLQEEKYNPRYLVFWRFVAGLLFDKQEAAKFFKQLHDTPIDLIGFSHKRLLIHCLSEVVLDTATQEYYSKEIDLLQSGLLRDRKVTGQIRLSHEMEFPEQILYNLLQNQLYLPIEAILEALSLRPMVQYDTLRLIAEQSMSSLSPSVCSLSTRVLMKHSTALPQNILKQSIDHLFSVLKNEKDWFTRQSSVVALGRQSLPDSAIDVLLLSLQDEDSDFQSFAAIALGAHSSLPGKAIDALLAAFENGNKAVQRLAAAALEKKSLPPKAIDALLAVLTDENEDMDEDEDEDIELRSAVADALGAQPLSEATINALLRQFSEPSGAPSSDIAAVLAGQPSLPPGVVNDLLAVLDGEDDYLRWAATEALRFQPNLPDRALDILCTLLKDENDSIRENAAVALGTQYFLTGRAIDALIVALEDEDQTVRYAAMLALEGQQSLPDRILDVLHASFNDEHEGISLRKLAASAMGKQSSLPIRILSGLLAALESNEKQVREFAAKALEQHSPLPEHFLAVLIRLVDDDTPEILNILHHHKLFFHGLKELDDHDWMKIWSLWRKLGQSKELSCYVLEELLYVWSSGKRYQISTNEEQTSRMLQVISKIPDSILEHEVDYIPELTYEDLRRCRRRLR